MNHDTKDLNQVEWTYKLKHVFCHDPGCWTCAQGKGHGPYWHASFEEEGQMQTVFLGKDFKPVAAKEQPTPSQSPPSQPETSSTQKPAANTAENRFEFPPKQQAAPQPQPAHPRQSKRALHDASSESSPPPTRFDFERDLDALKHTRQADSLKSVYRKLSKKYHPDKYPGIGYINTWMAELNGQYTLKKKSIRLF